MGNSIRKNKNKGISKRKSLSVSKWIRSIDIRGRFAFSFAEARQVFPRKSVGCLRVELSRAVARGAVISVYRGFYVIVPSQYALKRLVPPVYYVDELMRYLGKQYYVCLLSAAAMFGAGHQRPQVFSVMTVPPKSSVSQEKNSQILWCCRREIPSKFLIRKNTESGTILYSSPELTMLDLIQYEQYIGGYSRAATVLAELAESVQFDHIEELFPFFTIPTLQRLGYILLNVLEKKELASILREKMKKSNPVLNYVPLGKRNVVTKNSKRDRLWKVIVNVRIKAEEI